MKEAVASNETKVKTPRNPKVLADFAQNAPQPIKPQETVSTMVKDAIKKATEVAVGVAKVIQGEIREAAVQSGKKLSLSEQDIIRIMKVSSTEVVLFLKGKNFENQALGVIDTILNCTASGKFGGSVKDVINQPSAFSDINTNRKSAHGSVDKVPMKRISKKWKILLEIILRRVQMERLPVLGRISLMQI